MAVISVSGTTVHVQRGASGTTGAPHISGAMVLAGPPNAFISYDPSGTCTNGSGVGAGGRKKLYRRCTKRGQVSIMSKIVIDEGLTIRYKGQRCQTRS